MDTQATKMRPAIEAMMVRDSLEFPIIKLKSVRTIASELGAILDRKYITRADREHKTITVIRIS